MATFAKNARVGTSKKGTSSACTKKPETTFKIQTFLPKNEDYSLWFHLLSLFRVGLDDFHFRALLALISEGKSDQNEKCNFAKEGVLISKNWRKLTHLKIQFYIEKHVWQKVLGNLSDILVFSPSPNIHREQQTYNIFPIHLDEVWHKVGGTCPQWPPNHW